jgi:hypothetical protein
LSRSSFCAILMTIEGTHFELLREYPGLCCYIVALCDSTLGQQHNEKALKAQAEELFINLRNGSVA